MCVCVCVRGRPQLSLFPRLENNDGATPCILTHLHTCLLHMPSCFLINVRTRDSDCKSTGQTDPLMPGFPLASGWHVRSAPGCMPPPYQTVDNVPGAGVPGWEVTSSSNLAQILTLQCKSHPVDTAGYFRCATVMFSSWESCDWQLSQLENI